MGVKLQLSYERKDIDLRVFDGRFLRRMFGHMREQVEGNWRRLHNEEPQNLYALPNTVRVIKSRRMRWMVHVACMEEISNMYRILVVKSGWKTPP
jgi:hypothetical protein